MVVIIILLEYTMRKKPVLFPFPSEASKSFLGNGVRIRNDNHKTNENFFPQLNTSTTA
jgi:hypothetical protein